MFLNKFDKSEPEINQNLRKTLGRISMWELSISKVLKFQLALLPKMDSFTDSFERFANFQEKHFEVKTHSVVSSGASTLLF